MSFFNFGREQLQNGGLDNILSEVGIDDVGSFVNQFRQHANKSAETSGDDYGSNAAGGSNYSNMIHGAMNAYKMFNGGQGHSSGGGSFSNISSTVENAQKMHALYKQLDKNGDGKITAADVEILLQEMGLGAVSPFLAKAVFQAVDQDHNGTLDFTDIMALMTMVNKIAGQYGVSAPK